MLTFVYVTVAAVAGAAVAWWVAAGRTRLALREEWAGLQADLATARGTIAELRAQLEARQGEATTLRETLDAERQQRVEAQTRQEEWAKKFQEQRQLLTEAEQKLKETFEALSARALRTNAEQFLTTAKKTLDTVVTDTQGRLGKHQEAIQGLVKPLAEALNRLDTQNRQIEQARQKAYGSLEEQVRALTTTNLQLQQETGKLVTSLRDPRVRGRWGEIALRRAAELAGMSEHCDFQEQSGVPGDGDSRLRPDMIVHLPGKRCVVVDAKAVLAAYLDAVAATDEAERDACLKRHAEQVRSRVRELSSKSYWDRLDSTPEFVVLFLPGESFFSAAVEVDRDLIEEAVASRVVLASPTTLIALLRAVAFGWRQERVAENAAQISRLGRDLYDRMRTLAEHFNRVGSGLTTAINAYNQAVGSMEVRLLPAARRFKELGAAAGEDIPELGPVERAPRQLDNSNFEPEP